MIFKCVECDGHIETEHCERTGRFIPASRYWYREVKNALCGAWCSLAYYRRLRMAQ